MVHMYAKVGPKGQIVLPKAFRDENNIVSGETVHLDVKKIDSSNFLKTIESLPKIKLGKLDPHEAYEEQMMHRDRKRQRMAKKVSG